VVPDFLFEQHKKWTAQHRKQALRAGRELYGLCDKAQGSLSDPVCGIMIRVTADRVDYVYAYYPQGILGGLWVTLRVSQNKSGI
jgi:hypothetical protein